MSDSRHISHSKSFQTNCRFADVFIVQGWGCCCQVMLGLEVAVVALSGEAGPGTGHRHAKLGSFLLSLGKAESVLITLKRLGLPLLSSGVAGLRVIRESWGR